MAPGLYSRLPLIGYFEGIDGERGIAWRANDSLALRRFLRVGLDKAPPDHSTISHTRRLFDLGLVMRKLLGRGTPRGQPGYDAGGFLTALRLLSEVWNRKLTLQSDLANLPVPSSFSEPVNSVTLPTTKTTTSTTGC